MNPILRINTLGQQVDRELLLKALRDEAVLSLPYELLADYDAGAVTRDKDALIKYLKQGKFWRNVRESLLQGTNLHPPFFIRKLTIKLAKHNPALRASIGRVLNTSRGLRRYLPW